MCILAWNELGVEILARVRSGPLGAPETENGAGAVQRRAVCCRILAVPEPKPEMPVYLGSRVPGALQQWSRRVARAVAEACHVRPSFTN